MKEKIVDFVASFVKTSDVEGFLSLLKEKTLYIKKQPLDFLIASKSEMFTMLDLLKDFFKKRDFVPKNTLIALLLLVSFSVGSKVKKLSFLKENIDKDLLIGFCVYLVEKDIQRYLNLKGGSK